MKKVFFYIALCFLIFSESYGKDISFTISITIRKPVTIAVERNFNFGVHELTGSDFTVTVEPDGNGSAVFQIAGGNNSIVSYTVAEDEVYLSNGSDTIKVGGFKVTGGTKTGVWKFTEGELKNVGVGATAFIAANQPDTSYYGNATFRVTYN